MKRIWLLFAITAGTWSAAPAADLLDTCHAGSSYDLTLTAGSLLFERAAPARRRIEMRDGALRIDGAPMPLNAEDGDRLALFVREVRMLVPKARALAQRGLDLAAGVVRSETRALVSSAPARAELDKRIAAHVADLRRRIATSASTRDWQGAAFERDVDAMAEDLVPLLTADLGGQALTAALDGDVDAAVALQARAAELGNGLQPKIERRLGELRPDIAALCPSIRQLQELQQGLRDGEGRALDLVEIDR
ncbi:DUF2884 family protein [Dokdonella sp.]|uniref:DUF2884 family protein n=1 Tax=Dokdonella sp. TaxID=2291710 RepID=UPI003783C400